MHPILKQYMVLAEFLGKVLGPQYEITLHDLSSTEQSIATIVNGYISGRTVGAPLTDLALRFVKDKVYETMDYKVGYRGVSGKNSAIRSSTMFIKDDGGRLIGMLCINFDPSRYQKASQDILKLCGLDGEIFLEDNHLHPAGEVENFSDSISEVTDTVLKRYLKDGIPPERLTQEEKMASVKQLEERGIFLLKGAVNEVATRLHCSAASIYRYLGKINKQNESGN